MITSYIPKIEDLWFKETMLADPDTMSYNHAWGGTISFPEEKWQTWYEHWIKNPENKRYYRYLKDDSGCFIGEIAYHYDEELDIYLANVIVHAPTETRVMVVKVWICCVLPLRSMASGFYLII